MTDARWPSETGSAEADREDQLVYQQLAHRQHRAVEAAIAEAFFLDVSVINLASHRDRFLARLQQSGYIVTKRS